MSRPDRIHKECLNCGGGFDVPPCRDWREHCCSSECKTLLREKNRLSSLEERKRNCIKCGSVFYPRATQIRDGSGKYCSKECSSGHMKGVIWSAETLEKRSKSMLSGIASGKITYKSGIDHPQWEGGKAATYQRTKAKQVVKHKEWRAADPRRMRAHNAVIRNLINPGKCEKCGIEGKAHGHHPDYDKPLDVMWLCPKCHVREHKKVA